MEQAGFAMPAEHQTEPVEGRKAPEGTLQAAKIKLGVKEGLKKKLGRGDGRAIEKKGQLPLGPMGSEGQKNQEVA